MKAFQNLNQAELQRQLQQLQINSSHHHGDVSPERGPSPVTPGRVSPSRQTSGDSSTNSTSRKGSLPAPMAPPSYISMKTSKSQTGPLAGYPAQPTMGRPMSQITPMANLLNVSEDYYCVCNASNLSPVCVIVIH